MPMLMVVISSSTFRTSFIGSVTSFLGNLVLLPLFPHHTIVSGSMYPFLMAWTRLLSAMFTFCPFFGYCP